jgi:putative transposase
VKYQFITRQLGRHPVARCCTALAVSRSGYYAWCRRQRSARAHADARLLAQMQRLHAQTRERYGAVKLWRALQAAGIICGRHRVARLRRRHGLEARRTRRFRVTVEHHYLPAPAPNLLQQRFVAAGCNRIWVGDLTAIATRVGWVYVAILLDLYSRRVVGWALSGRPDQQLTLAALSMASAQRAVRPGLIHHTDQGIQYRSGLYRERLARLGITPSMSRKGNCYDNAVAESFFSTLKNELIHERTYATREEAAGEIFEFIEGFYNRRRLHQSLGYLSPLQFEDLQADS